MVNRQDTSRVFSRLGRAAWRSALLRVTAGLFLTVASPQPASAQFIEFMEWIDRLSGPGPFEHDPGWLPGVKIPIACVTEVSTDSQRQGSQDTTRYRFEALPGCLGIVALFRSLNPDTPPWGRDGEGNVIRQKRNVFSFDVKLARFASEDNELPYRGNPTEDQKKVKIGTFGLGARYLPHEATYLYTGWERHRFSSAGGLFESFNRDTVRLEIGVKPLWRVSALQGALKPLTIAAGMINGMGPFVARDFGAIGPFVADDERLAFVTIGYDIWHHGRFSR
jgi:hypothetical protein